MLLEAASEEVRLGLRTRVLWRGPSGLPLCRGSLPALGAALKVPRLSGVWGDVVVGSTGQGEHTVISLIPGDA